MRPSPPKRNRPRERKIEIHLRVVDLDADFAGIPCPDCHEPLNLHQPDENNPDQLLATCGTCSQWFAVCELGAGGGHHALLEIPGQRLVESLLSAPAGAPISPLPAK